MRLRSITMNLGRRLRRHGSLDDLDRRATAYAENDVHLLERRGTNVGTRHPVEALRDNTSTRRSSVNISAPNLGRWLGKHMLLSPRNSIRRGGSSSAEQNTRPPPDSMLPTSVDLSDSIHPGHLDITYPGVMDEMHFHLKSVLRSNHITALKSPRAILDIGTGTGVWLLEMASDFPDTRCIGIDTSNMYPTDVMPPNCRFDHADPLLALPYGDDSFDLLYLRFMEASVSANEWPHLLDEMHRVCRPGGQVELVVTDGMIRGNNSTVCKLLNNWYTLVLAQYNVDVRVVDRLPAMLHAQVGETLPVQFDMDPINPVLLSHDDMEATDAADVMTMDSGTTLQYSRNLDGPHACSTHCLCGASLATPRPSNGSTLFTAEEEEAAAAAAMATASRPIRVLNSYQHARFEQVNCLRLRMPLCTPRSDASHRQQLLRFRLAMLEHHRERLEQFGIAREQIDWAVGALTHEAMTSGAYIEVRIITGQRPA